jgi:hypothetical protein
MGNGPTKNDEPSELWVKLTELPRPLSEEMTFRARNEDVGTFKFWVLTAQELSTVRVEASRAAKKLFGDEAVKGNLAYEEEYEEQKALHLLALACRQPGDPRFPTFYSAGKARAELTDDEITSALMAYRDFRVRSGPMISELTPDEMEAWIKLLVEGGSRFPLAARLSGEALIDLTMFLVSKLRTSATGTSSAGSPPAASSTPTPPSESSAAPE